MRLESSASQSDDRLAAAGSETFSTAYCDLGRAYLAQSPQFYEQPATAGRFDRVTFQAA
jgi:hypothetical protein